MPRTVDLRMIESEIQKGLQNEARRLECAWKNRCFYDGDFERFPTREENQLHDRWDMRRTSRLARRVIHVLTAHLYKKPPTRTLAAGPLATDWLSRTYKRSAMQALWPQSDRMALVGDWCAFKFSGNEDPETVVDVDLYTSDQLVVWTVPGRPREVGAVATIEAEDAGRKLTLWTAEQVSEWYTPKWTQDQTAGGTAWKFRSRQPNPYGTIPFTFVHAEYPTTEFHTPGIGDFLRQVNEYVNFDLDDTGDAKRYLKYPIPVAQGVSPTWTPPGKLKPGQWVLLPGNLAMAGEDALSRPELTFVTPPLEFVMVSWDDTNQFIDRALEDLGIPPGSVRMVQGTSGVQLMIEEGPLLAWAEARRQPFADYEAEAAGKAAQVAAAHLRSNGRPVPPWLDATAREPGLALRWPPLYVQLPGPERDRSDDYRVANGYASKVQVLCEREDLTRDQAIEKLKQIETDNAELEAIGIDPKPTSAAAPPENAPLDEPMVEPPSGD